MHNFTHPYARASNFLRFAFVVDVAATIPQNIEAASVIDFELAVGIGLGNILVCQDFNQSIFQFCYPDRIETSFPLCRASHPFLFGQQQPVAPVEAQCASVLLQMLAPSRALQ